MPSIPVDSPRGHTSASARGPRAEQLAKVLQADIVQLISTGSLGEDLINVEIAKVHVTADLNNVNIYWMASGGSRDDEIQEKLSIAANKLRSMLISLRPIGRVPPITFVRDLSQSRQRLIDFLIDTADKGPAEERIVCDSNDVTSLADASGSNIHTISDAYGVDRNRLLEKLAKGSRVVREVSRGPRNSDSAPSFGSSHTR